MRKGIPLVVQIRGFLIVNCLYIKEKLQSKIFVTRNPLYASLEPVPVSFLGKARTFPTDSGGSFQGRRGF